MRTEVITINAERNVTLTVYLQPSGGEFRHVVKRPAVLIIPGGGYIQCSDTEAEPVALAYLDAGYQAFVLRYSVGKHAQWPNPLEDYEAAMELIRSKEIEWELYADKIAVIGFSAGGHLAACAATMSKNRPNAAILGYAITDQETAASYLSSAPDAVAAVDDQTCPCFFFAGRNDTVVPVRNTVKMMQALTDQDITYESHIYAYASHGFSTCKSAVAVNDGKLCNRTHQWVADSIEWLKDLFGDFDYVSMSAPKCGAWVNGNYEKHYNLYCTTGYLLKNQRVASILMPYINPLLIYYQTDAVPDIFCRMLLNQLLSYLRVPEQVMQDLEKTLRLIPKE